MKLTNLPIQYIHAFHKNTDRLKKNYKELKVKLIFDNTDQKNIWLRFRGFKVFESDCIQINET